MKAVESSMPHSSVRIFETEASVSKRGVVTVMILNAGAQPLNFGSENVSFSADGTPAETISYERLAKEERNRQTWAAVATALGAAANSMNAANAGNTYGSINTYGSRGWSTSTFTTYNPAAASLAQNAANAQNQASFDRLASTNAAAMEALKANVRTTTVDPGQPFGGSVVFELPKKLRNSKLATPLTITVRVGDESHVFNAVVEPTMK